MSALMCWLREEPVKSDKGLLEDDESERLFRGGRDREGLYFELPAARVNGPERSIVELGDLEWTVRRIDISR